jgi:hypothetical protein
MPRAKNIRLKGVVERHADAVALTVEPGDVAIVSRNGLRSLAIQCPDGCGDVLSVNLDARTGPAWRLFRKEGTLTLYPSVWKKSGCEAHFIVWKDDLIWCDVYEMGSWHDDRTKKRIWEVLPKAGSEHRHFEAIAAELDLIPWEAYWACRLLESDGVAVSSQRGTYFGLAKSPSGHRAKRIDRSV